MSILNKPNRILLSPLIIVGIFLIFFYSFNPVCADQSQIYVNPSGNDNYNGEYAVWQSRYDGPKKTIKNAVGTVSSDGIVKLAKGTYYEHDITISKNVNIQGTSRDSTVINAQDKGRIFTLNYGKSLTLNSLTLTNGHTSDNGGAVYVNHGKLGSTNVKYIGNNANGLGGVIYSSHSELNLAGNRLESNRAFRGGAIYDNVGSLNLVSCYLKNNVAVTGGAIYHYEGTLKMDQDNFYANTANGDSGGAVFAAHCNFDITNTSMTSNYANGKVNSANGRGGGIYNLASNLNMNNCVFTHNTGSSFGGGISIYNPCHVTILNTIFTANRAVRGEDGGGAVSNYYATTTIQNCKFYNNTAPVGGAIINYNANLLLKKNYYMGNRAANGATVRNFKGNVTLISCTFKSNESNNSYSNNVVKFYGGAGIYNDNTQFAVNEATITVLGCTFINNIAKSGTGGAIKNGGGTLTVSNSIFTGNVAPVAAGILNYMGILRSTNNTFTSNKATDVGGGGAIYNYKRSATIVGNTFRYNSAINGAAINNYYGTLSVKSSNFSRNSASSGAAIYTYGGSIMSSNNNLASNKASDGGAITSILSTVKLYSNNFTGNIAKGKGGAVYNVRSTMIVTNTKFTSNRAPGGGAIYNHYGNLNLTSNTFKTNVSTSGSALYNYFGKVTYRSNILSGNVGKNINNVHGTITT